MLQALQVAGYKHVLAGFDSQENYLVKSTISKLLRNELVEPAILFDHSKVEKGKYYVFGDVKIQEER